MRDDRPPLAQGDLDRDAPTRMDPERLAVAWTEPGARVLRVRAADAPVIETEAGPRLSLVPTSGAFAEWRDRSVFVGRVNGDPVFAIGDSDEASSVFGTPEGESWEHPFVIVADLEENDRQVLGVGSALLRWHESAGFSSRDGLPTTHAQGGWARLDDNGGEHFPRTDPAVIVLVEHDDRMLLGSNVLWETGRFSLLAGFVEAGESLEQAVEREIFEEAGVRLGEIEYVTSQPWPFPRSLMLGFRARLAPGQDPADLAPDPEEISELRWFTREEARNPDPSVTLPGKSSIARWLIDRWIAEGDGSPGDDVD